MTRAAHEFRREDAKRTHDRQGLATSLNGQSASARAASRRVARASTTASIATENQPRQRRSARPNNRLHTLEPMQTQRSTTQREDKHTNA